MPFRARRCALAEYKQLVATGSIPCQAVADNVGIPDHPPEVKPACSNTGRHLTTWSDTLRLVLDGYWYPISYSPPNSFEGAREALYDRVDCRMTAPLAGRRGGVL